MRPFIEKEMRIILVLQLKQINVTIKSTFKESSQKVLLLVNKTQDTEIMS